MLAVGAGGGCFGHFFSPFISLFFLPLSGRRRETLSQRAVKPITTNQPIINGQAFSVPGRASNIPYMASWKIRVLLNVSSYVSQVDLFSENIWKSVHIPKKFIKYY